MTSKRVFKFPPFLYPSLPPSLTPPITTKIQGQSLDGFDILNYMIFMIVYGFPRFESSEICHC